MKKLFIFFLISTIITNNIFISFSFAQEQPQENQNIDFSPYKLQCNILKPIEIEEIEEVAETTSSIDYISELENFSGDLPKTDSFLEGLIKSALADLVVSAISSLLENIWGKVPVGAPETNRAIMTSVKESTKNILGSIKTSLQLAIQDAIMYFKFQLINKLNEFIYGKILKNFIYDINAYKNFRLLLIYQRGFNKIFERYKNLSCIPKEIRPCLEGLINNAYQNALDFANKSESSSKLIKFLNVFYKYQIAEILNKKECDFYEAQKAYSDLYLAPPPLSEEEIENYGGYYAIKKPEKYIAKIENQKGSFFANIFNIFNKLNFKNLRAQILPNLPEEAKNSLTIFFNLNEFYKTQTTIANCFTIQDRYAARIIKDLNDEIEKLNIQVQQPGGLTFKPKTQCLKTWAEVEHEEVSRELAKAMEEGDQQKIGELDKKLQDINQKIEKLKEISGEDPNCAIPGPTLSSPADYEKLKEQILTSPLEIFKSQERATNVLVAFIRSWAASKLFKIIDKGFASLEAKSQSNTEYLSDIKNAYRPERIQKICSEFNFTAIKGSDITCRSVMQSQLKKITEIEKENIKNLSSKTVRLISNFSKLLSVLNSYSASTTIFNNYLKDYEPYVTPESLNELDNIISNIDSYTRDLDEIKNYLSRNTSTIEQILSKNVLDAINSSTAYYQERINEIDNQIENIKSQIDAKTNEINSIMSQVFSGLNASMITSNKISLFFERYPIDLEKAPLNNPLEYIGIDVPNSRTGENPIYTSCLPSLGNKIKFSFFTDFYPTHIYNCLSNKNYSDFEFRFNNSTLDTDPWDGTDPKLGKDNDDVATYFIVHDLIYIFYSLYNAPYHRSGVQQENLVISVQNFLTTLLTNPPKSSQQTIENELNILYNYFSSLENYASNTLNYAKNRGILNKEFYISNQPSKFDVSKGQAIFLRIEESLDLILKTANIFKQVIEAYKNILESNKGFLDSLRQISDLEKQKDDLIKEMNSKTDAIWGDYLNSIDLKELQSMQDNLEQNLDKINNYIEKINELCERYNSLIDKIEDEVKSKLEEQKMEETTPSPSLPPTEGSEGESKIEIRTERVSLIKRMLNITVGLFANIFSIFNIFKEKKIYIK